MEIEPENEYEKNLKVTIKPAKSNIKLEPPKTNDDPKIRKQKPKPKNEEHE